jgi:hypothetical protein
MKSGIECRASNRQDESKAVRVIGFELITHAYQPSICAATVEILLAGAVGYARSEKILAKSACQKELSSFVKL